MLKKNSKFTSYSQYINKNVIDIQLAYEKNKSKCRLSLVRKLFKAKSKRELVLAFVSVFKSIYSEFVVRMDKALESGSSFTSSLYEIPSEHIKFELLKVLRTQLTMFGPDAFKQILELISEFSKILGEGITAETNSSVITELTPFYTEMMGNTIKSEISGSYEFVRDLLWFSNWLIDSGYDIRGSSPHDHLYQNDIITPDKKKIQNYDSVCKSLLSLKICTHSLCINQENLNDHLSNSSLKRSDLNKHTGFNDMMPFFIVKHYKSLLSCHLESISMMENIHEVIVQNFCNIALFNTDSLSVSFIPSCIQQLVRMKEFEIVDRAVSCLKHKNPALHFTLAVCKANRGNTEEFKKHFWQGITSISTQGEDSSILQEKVFGNLEYDNEFLEIAQNCKNPALIFAKSCLDQIDRSNAAWLFEGIQAALHFRFNHEDEYEVGIIDKIWIDFYDLCLNENDIELAFVAATSINNDLKRETCLGRLIENLIVNDSLNNLFNCRLSNKNFLIAASYLKKRINESLNKVLQDNGERQSDFFKADKVFLKILKALHSLYSFYNKNRESCQYMLKVFFEIQGHKKVMHVNLRNILECEKYLLSLILAETKTFDNSEKHLYYIDENDIYNLVRSPKKHRDSDVEDLEMIEEELMEDSAKRLFLVNPGTGKYIINLKDIETLGAVNEAQLVLFNRCEELITETDEIIDFLAFYNRYDLAIHMSITHKIDPKNVIQQLAFKYCEKANNVGKEEDSDLDQLEGFEFEDASYGWSVDEGDHDVSEVKILLDLLQNTVLSLRKEYPHLRTEALKIIFKNHHDFKNFDTESFTKLGEGITEEGLYDINMMLRKVRGAL
jgi:hypothetical protein